MPKPIQIEISPGELLDRLSIVSIKARRIADPLKRTMLAMERGVLLDQANNFAHLQDDAKIYRLFQCLVMENERLWACEETVRQLAKAGDYGSEFLRTAQFIHIANDLRAAYKAEVNAHLKYEGVQEVKSYELPNVGG